LKDQVKTGGDTSNRGLWERVVERLDERVSPTAVARPHATQMAVEFTTIQEVVESVLSDSEIVSGSSRCRIVVEAA
jgi:hypothetical protein